MNVPARFRARVDFLIKAEKTIIGEAAWQNGPYDGAFRWLSPVAVDGVTIGMNLCVDSFPRTNQISYHILLIYETCISRLDFSENDRHLNHAIKRISVPPGIDLGWIYGPHFHRWIDNRMLADTKRGPKELKFAVPLSLSVSSRSFDSVFRHFCGECNIVVAANQMPSLPLRDTIL